MEILEVGKVDLLTGNSIRVPLTLRSNSSGHFVLNLILTLEGLAKLETK